MPKVNEDEQVAVAVVGAQGWRLRVASMWTDDEESLQIDFGSWRARYRAGNRRPKRQGDGIQVAEKSTPALGKRHTVASCGEWGVFVVLLTFHSFTWEEPVSVAGLF